MKKYWILVLTLARLMTNSQAQGAAPDAGVQTAPRPAAVHPLETENLPACATASLVPAPCRPVSRRRAVPQIIERMPSQRQPFENRAGAPAALPPPAARPASPLPLTQCDAGNCRDAAGVLHNGGVGNATLDPNGRLCNRDGAWLQCF